MLMLSAAALSLCIASETLLKDCVGLLEAAKL